MRSTSLFTTALRSLPIFTACLALPNLSFAGDYTWAKPALFLMISVSILSVISVVVMIEMLFGVFKKLKNIKRHLITMAIIYTAGAIWGVILAEAQLGFVLLVFIFFFLFTILLPVIQYKVAARKEEKLKTKSSEEK